MRKFAAPTSIASPRRGRPSERTIMEDTGNGGARGKVVLIAGATGGLGRVVTPMFVKAGAKVVLVARHHDQLENLAAATGVADTDCLVKDVDLRDPAQARDLIVEVISCFGRIDIVVNLVGSWAPGRITATSDDLWREQLASNLFTVFHVLREAVPHMSEG